MRSALLLLLLSLVTMGSVYAQKDSSKPVPAHQDFLGKYMFPPGSVVPDVEVVGDSLHALTMNSQQGNSPLVHQGGDEFTITNFEGTASFKRSDSTREVTGVHIEAMGYILDGEKSIDGKSWTWKITKASPAVLARRDYSNINPGSSD